MAEDKVVIEFAYPYSHLFDVTYEKMMPKFYEQHPNVEVEVPRRLRKLRRRHQHRPARSRLGQSAGRDHAGPEPPAILVEKNIAKSLEPFIAKEADFAKDGYHRPCLIWSTFNGDVHGLPFSVSLPVGYYNMDLMKPRLASTELPTTWDEVIAACKTMKANGIENPMFWGWNITGNWFVQALMWTQDAPSKDGARSPATKRH
jgi:multiple sugar transport system substrate-binding protein